MTGGPRRWTHQDPQEEWVGHSNPFDRWRIAHDARIARRHIVHACRRAALVEITQEECRTDRRQIARDQHRPAIIDPQHEQQRDGDPERRGKRRQDVPERPRTWIQRYPAKEKQGGNRRAKGCDLRILGTGQLDGQCAGHENRRQQGNKICRQRNDDQRHKEFNARLIGLCRTSMVTVNQHGPSHPPPLRKLVEHDSQKLTPVISRHAAYPNRPMLSSDRYGIRGRPGAVLGRPPRLASQASSVQGSRTLSGRIRADEKVMRSTAGKTSASSPLPIGFGRQDDSLSAKRTFYRRSYQLAHRIGPLSPRRFERKRLNVKTIYRNRNAI